MAIAVTYFLISTIFLIVLVYVLVPAKVSTVAKFRIPENVEVCNGVVPLQLIGSGNKNIQALEGSLIVRQGGSYEVVFWAVCSIRSGGVGSEGTVKLTLAQNEWVQTLYRYQGGFNYTNVAMMGSLKVKTGQTISLTCERIDGIATLYIEKVELIVM